MAVEVKVNIGVDGITLVALSFHGKNVQAKQHQCINFLFS
jgi:hypothetical protein